MINNTGTKPTNRILSNSCYGFHTLNTTAMPHSLANEIMNQIFHIEETCIDTITEKYYSLTTEDFFQLEEQIEIKSKKNEKLIKLFEEFE